MTLEPQQAIIDKLDQLLERERAALLGGDLERIGQHMEEKQELIDALNLMQTAQPGAFEHSSMSRMKDKVERNQALLQGAMEGIRAVADRIAGLRKVRDGLETYDQSGRKTQFSTGAQTNVERRA